jgi:uncharacterized protein YbaP (TraB family)
MKKLVLFFAFSLSVFCGSAQELENSLLWEISGNGLEKSSYLFGTIHITCDASLSDEVKKAMDNTSQLVLEIDMDDPQMQMKMMRGMRMKEGKSLKDFLNDEEFAAVDSLFQKNMGMSVAMLQTVKPMLLNSMLIPKLLDCAGQSVESELMKIAKAQQEDINGLETIEYQLAVFDEIPYEDQAKELAKSAKDNLAESKEALSKLMKIYNTQNITGMLEMMHEGEDNMMAKHQDKMFDTRNKNWISEIGKYAKEQPTFFGVGAGHLAGENGVINLLRNAGYTVKAINN